MTVEELMKLSAEHAANELTLESIEFLFRPSTTLELLLRSDFHGTCKRFETQIAEVARFKRSVEIEELYRTIKDIISEDKRDKDSQYDLDQWV